MDKYEKEYFESLRPNAKPFEENLNQVAKERLKVFAATITRLVSTEKETFDLIVGPGNSGIFMTFLTQLTYEQLGINKPPVVNIPLSRVMENNRVVGVKAPDKIEIPNEVRKVLFVDDEIMRGSSAKSCLDLIISNSEETKNLEFVIVAENHFFEWHYKTPGISVRFFGYSRLIQWVNGIMGHLLTDEYFRDVDMIPEIETYNDALAIVLGGAIKKETDPPSYDFNVEEVIKTKMPDYQSKKDDLLREVKELIKQGVDDYQSGKIVFEF